MLDAQKPASRGCCRRTSWPLLASNGVRPWGRGLFYGGPRGGASRGLNARRRRDSMGQRVLWERLHRGQRQRPTGSEQPDACGAADARAQDAARVRGGPADRSARAVAHRRRSGTGSRARRRRRVRARAPREDTGEGWRAPTHGDGRCADARGPSGAARGGALHPRRGRGGPRPVGHGPPASRRAGQPLRRHQLLRRARCGHRRAQGAGRPSPSSGRGPRRAASRRHTQPSPSHGPSRRRPSSARWPRGPSPSRTRSATRPAWSERNCSGASMAATSTSTTAASPSPASTPTRRAGGTAWWATAMR